MSELLKSCVVLGVALSFMGCSGTSVPAGPSAVVLPVTAPPGTALSVSRGSTGGGTQIKITGPNLPNSASVAFGNATVTSTGSDPHYESGTTSLLITSPPHPAGVVDLVITTAGRPILLSGAFEFVDQQAFDFNGNWSGVTIDGSDVALDFAIRDNVLVSASCAYDKKTKLVLSAEATGGSFLAQGQEGPRLSGRIVSASQATGTVTAPDCGGVVEGRWQAYKAN